MVSAFNALLGYSEKRQHTETETQNALATALCYLIRHKVGRESGLNLLQFESQNSVSRQHVSMIRIIEKNFPNLIAQFNGGELFDQDNEALSAQIAQEQYSKFIRETGEILKDRKKVESEYAVKQGLIFAGISAAVGSTVQGIIFGVQNLAPSVSSLVPSASASSSVPSVVSLSD